jgi:hypothetical protein
VVARSSNLILFMTNVVTLNWITYLVNTTGPVPLVMDLHIVHGCRGSISDPSLNGHLHYPNDLDGSLNEGVCDKTRQYRADYNNRPSNNAISLMSSCLLFVLQDDPVYVRRVDPSALSFSLSLHRHSYISILCSSRFISS